MKKATVAVITVLLLMMPMVSYGAEADTLKECNILELIQLGMCNVESFLGNGETLYLSDSAGPEDGITILYRAELEPMTQSANLSLLPAANIDPPLGPGEIPLENALAIAVNASGRRLYAVDKYSGDDTGHMGYYILTTATWVDVGQVKLGGTPLAGVTLAAFSPQGVLYVASEETDSLYSLDVETAEATLLGAIKKDSASGDTLNVLGGDLAFTGTGIMYLWTNGSAGGALAGLYKLNLPAVDGAVIATYLGSDAESFVTGLAVGEDGVGELVGSTLDGKMLVIDKSDGSIVGDPFPMQLSGSPCECSDGDMSAGKLIICTRTIGYYKNHSWEGETVTICDVVVDEELGKEIMWNANGTNFSMLFAQLIAAKLNCEHCRYEDKIARAEAWLCSQPGIINEDGTLNWDKEFDSERQKKIAECLWRKLDCFNNNFECDE